MPYLNSTQTDLEPAQAGGQSFNGGQFSAARQSIIPEDAYWIGLNVDNDEFGNAITRRGSISLDTAAPGAHPFCQGFTTFFQTSLANQASIGVFDGYIYKYDNAGTWTNIGGAYPVDSGNSIHVTFGQVGGKLYLANTDNVLYSLDYAATLVDQHGTNTNSDPPDPLCVCEHTNRLVLVDKATKCNLYFSQFGNAVAGQWDRTLWVRQVGADNFKITGILPWSNYDLFVMKEDSLWTINCNPVYAVGDFECKPLHRNIGTQYPRTAAQVGTNILLLTRLGVLEIDRSQSTDVTTQINEPISRPIQDLINRINWSAAADNASGFYFNNRYFLNVPLDDDTTTVTTIVYNTISKKWLGSWGRTLDPHAMAPYQGLSPNRCRWGRSDGKVYEWLDYIQDIHETNTTYQDAGTSYPSTVETRAYDFGDPDSYKDLSTLKMEFLNSKSGEAIVPDAMVDIEIRQDGRGGRNVNSGFDTRVVNVTLPQVLPFQLPVPGIKPLKIDLSDQVPCLEVSAVAKADSGRMCLRKVIFSAFVGSTGVEATQPTGIQGTVPGGPPPA